MLCIPPWSRGLEPPRVARVPVVDLLLSLSTCKFHFRRVNHHDVVPVVVAAIVAVEVRGGGRATESNAGARAHRYTEHNLVCVRARVYISVSPR